ncbi:MAG: hypothetical protein AAFP69_05495, partial [Planctomycetota bacterium]
MRYASKACEQGIVAGMAAGKQPLQYLIAVQCCAVIGCCVAIESPTVMGQESQRVDAAPADPDVDSSVSTGEPVVESYESDIAAAELGNRVDPSSIPSNALSGISNTVIPAPLTSVRWFSTGRNTSKLAGFNLTVHGVGDGQIGYVPALITVTPASGKQFARDRYLTIEIYDEVRWNSKEVPDQSLV